MNAKEVIRFASKLPDGRPLDVEAIITQGVIIFKFKDAGMARDMFYKEKSSGSNVRYFERLSSFAEIYDGKDVAELKTILIEKIKARGLTDWTDVIAGKVVKKAKREKHEV